MRTSTALVLVATIAGCSDDTSGGPIGIEDFAGAQRSAICRVAAKCGLVDDVVTCLGLRLGGDLPPGLIEAVHAGTVLFDSAKARVCIDGMASWSCEGDVAFSSRFTPPECTEVISGTIAGGGACARDEACVSQLCSMSACPPDMCCAGTCSGDTPPASRPRLGESCTGTCYDSFCNQTSLICEPLKPAGASCVSTSECARGLSCGGAAGTCDLLPRKGQPCPDGECGELGAFCSPTTGNCTAFGLTGDACGQTAPCSEEIYACDPTTSECKLGPMRGESCNGLCLDRSFCDPQTLVCSPLLADGSPCMSSQDCASDQCDFNTMTCQTPPACF